MTGDTPFGVDFRKMEPVCRVNAVENEVERS
jgi:hypothetical protein